MPFIDPNVSPKGEHRRENAHRASHRRKLRERAIALLRSLTIAASSLALLTAALVGVFLFLGEARESPEVIFGVTFGHSQAISLGLDGAEAYRALLDDLKVRRFRIPVYWDELEVERGRYDFSPWDAELDALKARGGKAILAVGRKLPRWPECREPMWFHDLAAAEQDRAILDMVAATVLHYRNHEAVWAWQVENEPFLSFGICPKDIAELLDAEIALVRTLDPTRPIIITDTGEFSTWLQAGKRADILGSTLYRTIHNPRIGFVHYPFPPVMYHRKRIWIRLWYPKLRVIFTEVQAEPWVTQPPISQYPIETQYATMSPDRFRAQIAYARRTGFDEMYLWGAEWWYWLKVHGHPEIWEAARPLFSPSGQPSTR